MVGRDRIPRFAALLGVNALNSVINRPRGLDR